MTLAKIERGLLNYSVENEYAPRRQFSADLVAQYEADVRRHERQLAETAAVLKRLDALLRRPASPADRNALLGAKRAAEQTATQHRNMLKMYKRWLREQRRDMRAANDALANAEATKKLLKSRLVAYDAAARTVQRAYRKAAWSPHTGLGRRQILRAGGFDPANYPDIVKGQKTKKQLVSHPIL